MGKYDLNTVTIGELLEDPQVVEIVDQYAPGMANNPAANVYKGVTVDSALGMAGRFVPAETIDAVRSRIESL